MDATDPAAGVDATVAAALRELDVELAQRGSRASSS